MTQYTGHSAKHDGLQGHSIGDYYPIITTRYGDNTHGLILGGYELRGNTLEHNEYLRGLVHKTRVLHGWNAAIGFFKRAGATPAYA